MDKQRVQDIADRYRKKSENAFRTYQETGKSIYDWFYREYDDISMLASESLGAVDTANQLTSLRVTFSDILTKLERGADAEEIKKRNVVLGQSMGNSGMRYIATFFPDPYDTGIRDVIMSDDDMEFLVTQVVEYLKENPCGYILTEYDGTRFHGMSREWYREINHRLGRF